jgi:hypothetical protein
MERLTIPDVRVDEHTTRRSVIDVLAVREHAMEFYFRLKAYEDMVDLETLNNTPISRLAELAEADRDGRVVVKPCKVGETVYFARANPILQYKVTGYEMGEASISQVRSKHIDKETGLTFNFTFRPGSIGKTVFLSREEAEKALEEREGKKNGNETSM